MAVTDSWSRPDPATDQAPLGGDRQGTAVAVVSALLAITTALILVLSHSINQLSDVVTEIFPSLTVDVIVLSLVLLAGAIVTLIPTSRTTGLGILMAVGGVLTFEWTGLSINSYSSPFDYGYGSRFSGTEVTTALICLAISVALCAVSAIGIARLPRVDLLPDRDASPARIFLIIAAGGALATVLLIDFYPEQFAFREFSPFGNFLDLLGIVAFVGPFIVLAVVLCTRRPAIGATAAWLGTVTFITVSDLTDGFTSDPLSEFHYDWKSFLNYPAIAFTGVFAVIGISKLASTPTRASSLAFGAPIPCSNGHSMSPSAQFCPFCGAPPQPAPAVGAPRCPNGHLVPGGDTFCSECGQAVQAVPAAPAAPWMSTGVNVPPPSPYAGGYPQWNGYPSNNGFAIAALICGILGASVLGVAFGFVARSQIRQSMGRQKGDGMALAGIILGFIWIVLSIAFTVSIYVFLAHQNTYPYN